MDLTAPKVTIVHDYLTQRGGAERVVLNLLSAFPGATVLTSCWRPSTTYPEFRDHRVETLWPDAIPALRRDPRRAFPVLARTFAQTVVDDADVVICSSSGWSHRVRATVPKVVYCHNPPRWLYQPEDYLHVVPRIGRSAFIAATRRLSRSDGVAAHDADLYVANSRAVGDRITATYGIEPAVVCPPRGLSPTGPQEPVPGLEPGFLLTIGRARAYKNTDVVCAAVRDLPDERLVVVGGLPAGDWPDRLTGLSEIDDARMRWLYANAAGLVAVAHEDFGLTVVEAQAFGLPTVVLRAGGYLDSTSEGVTGVFVDDSTATAVAAGIVELRRRRWDPLAIRAHGEQFAPEVFEQRMRLIAEMIARRPAHQPEAVRSAPAVQPALGWA